jgi:nucleotide-binding universal stress UspA family protein
MPEFRRICCPIDFSEESRPTLEAAARLARDQRAGLTVLHVRESTLPGAGPAAAGLGDPGEMARLEAWRADAERIAGSTVSSVFLSPPAAEAILAFARDVGVDLIVMASHGRTGVGRMVAGSVAESVLRNAPCPVLVYREPPGPPSRDGVDVGAMPA